MNAHLGAVKISSTRDKPLNSSGRLGKANPFDKDRFGTYGEHSNKEHYQFNAFLTYKMTLRFLMVTHFPVHSLGSTTENGVFF